MPFLRAATGLLPMKTGGGSPLQPSPTNSVGPTSPPIITPPSGFNFDMATGTKRGWPGSNNQFDNYRQTREWNYNFADLGEGFAGIRWQPTWFDVNGFVGWWQPAGGDVNRIQRKGPTGQDSRTLVLNCSPNSLTIPVGEPVVLWENYGEYDNPLTTAFNLNGYNMPVRSKMTVTGGSGSPAYDTVNPRVIEVDAGTALPAIDFTPPRWTSGGFNRSTIQHRHWRFLANTATNEMRFPMNEFSQRTVTDVIGNGGYAMLGGDQFQPTGADWTQMYAHFGATLTTELFRLECEGLAAAMGNTDPNRLAVELENEPTSEWHNAGGTGYGDLLASTWYPIARAAWGPERTIVVKANGFGHLNNLIDIFDFACPAGHNMHLVIHDYDGMIQGPSGSNGFGSITETNWIADQIRTKINALGYRGGGATEIGVNQGTSNGDTDRGQRLGRLLTSFTNQNLYMFVWALVGDGIVCSEIRNVNGHLIEAYWPGISPYARRAGIMTT